MNTTTSNLEYLAFHLTYLCGNKCPYCYIGDEGRVKHPPFETIKKVAEKITKGSVKEILLLGGDPCTYPYLKEIIELIKDSGLKVDIQSNTLGFSDFEFFANQVDSFETTILGTEKEHDKEVRRDSAYKTLINNIKRLDEAGKKVTIFLTIHPGNQDKIFEMVSNLVNNEKIGIESVSIQRVVPMGRAINTLQYSLGTKHLLSIFKQAERIKNELGLKVWFEDPFPLCQIPEKYHYLSTTPCVWGFTKGSINFSGNLSRCGADNRFSLGNVIEIDDLQKFWRENPVLVDFRSRKWLPEKCQKCELLEKCGGGCSLSRMTASDHESDLLCSFS